MQRLVQGILTRSRWGICQAKSADNISWTRGISSSSVLAEDIEVPHDIRMHEPPYLDVRPDVPQHEPLTVHLRGYDFPELELLHSYAHRLAQRLGIDVTDTYAMPPRTHSLKTYRPRSTIQDATYRLARYHRVLQFEGAPSTALPLFLEALTQNLPQGVEVSLSEYDEEEEEVRYIPDKELDALQNQLQDMIAAREEKKKK